MNRNFLDRINEPGARLTVLVSLLFVYYLGKMLYFALNIGTNISPDEITWIGQSLVYSKSVLLPQNSPESYQYGLVTRVPYLYPWLMGKVIHLNFFGISDLVFLRLVNVGIGMGTLWFGWKTISLLTERNITRLLFVVLCTNTLMLTFLSSFVSYDNLVNFLATGTLYFLILFFKNRVFSHLLTCVIFILAGCLTKQAFLPLALLVFFAFLFREYRNLGALTHQLKDCFLLKSTRQSVLMVLCIALLGLNLGLHAGNLVKFKSLSPSVEAVIGLDNAMQNRIFARNYITRQYRAGKLSLQQARQMATTQIKHQRDRSDTMALLNVAAQEKMRGAPQRLDRFRYAFVWTDMMLGRTFGILGHKDMVKRGAALVPYMVVILLTAAVMIRKFNLRDLAGNAAMLLLFVAGYAAILMQYVNYRGYETSGLIVLAVQGRYLFPVIYAAYALMAYYLTSFESRRLNLFAAIAVAALFIIGEFPWFLSHVTPDWYFID